MKRLRLILGVVVGFLCISTALLMEGGHLSQVYAITAIIMTIGSTFCLTFLAISRPKTAKLIWARNCLFGLSVGAEFLNIQKVMNVMDQPEFMGPGIAVALISLLYGAAGGIVLKCWQTSISEP